MKKILLSFVLAGLLFSCKQPSSDIAVVSAPVDSLINNWGISWNNHDSAAVRNMFASDALLTDDLVIASGTDEISAKMISPYIRSVSNFKASKLQEWSTNERAGYTGRYEFDAVVNNSVVAKPQGVFSVNWIKTESGEWKITTAVIYSFVEQK
jgi:ketosteroid isomerase-like protein